MSVMCRALLVAIAFGAVGCDRVFGLDAPDAGPASCPYTQLAADGDDDHDGALNGVDGCPLVADHELHDEDGDGIADACDPCPIYTAAGADLDCDAIGAACDPDDTIGHVQEFYGLGSTRGLMLYGDATLANDEFHFRQTADGYGRVRVTTASPATGRYEVHARVTGIDAMYWTSGFYVEDATGAQYRISVLADSGTGGLRILDPTGTVLAATSLGTVGTSIEYTLQLEITDTELRARVSGFGTGTAAAMLPSPLGSIEWGFTSYRDNPFSSTFEVAATYLSRIAPEP